MSSGEPSVYTDDLHDDFAPIDYTVSDWAEVERNFEVSISWT